MKAEQYRPAFLEGFEEKENHFNIKEELLRIDWVKNFSKQDNFYKFSLSRDREHLQHTLMAEYEEGFKWYVVAIIRDEDISGIDDLPEWEMKREKGERLLTFLGMKDNKE